MNNTASAQRASRLDIAADRATSVEVEAGAAIQVVSGRIWLTQEGDPRDYAVPAGVTFCTDRRGRAVLTAIDGTSVVLIVRDARCVQGTLRIDSLERITQEARRAQARYVADMLTRTLSRVARSFRRLARLLRLHRARLENAC